MRSILACLISQSTLQLPVKIAKTGVKHLHHAAVVNFDIGIYFEANGHGTVVFSKTYEHFAIQQKENGNPFFVKLHQLINPAVGDALCDLLLVCCNRHWVVGHYSNGMIYTKTCLVACSK
jgi:hypothetical protein